MKILLVSGPGISLKEPYNSGIESFMVSFAKQLSAEGHEVDIIAAEADENSSFKIKNPFKSQHSAKHKYVESQIEKFRFKNFPVASYDVIHYHMFYPHLLKAGLSFNKNIFLTLHSPPDAARISVYSEVLKRGNFRFVAISKRIKNLWDFALQTDIPLINNGIDLDLWPVEKAVEKEYLLWSARINEEKNPAAAIKLAQKTQLPLIIAGRIASQKYFDEQVKPHLNDQIRYVGHMTQQKLNGFAQRAFAFLATATWQEPFGLAALEMLASGIPVVGFKTAVPPNWNDECVLVADSTDWQDLPDLVSKSFTVNAEKCRKFASGMTVQKMTADYISLFENVLNESNKAVSVKENQEVSQAATLVS